MQDDDKSLETIASEACVYWQTCMLGEEWPVIIPSGEKSSWPALGHS